MTRPWTLPDVRDVFLAIVIFQMGVIALTWYAADKTAQNRFAALAECPGPEPVARRVVDLASGQVRCTYWRLP